MDAITVFTHLFFNSIRINFKISIPKNVPIIKDIQNNSLASINTFESPTLKIRNAY